jgi:hypothetical protein
MLIGTKKKMDCLENRKAPAWWAGRHAHSAGVLKGKSGLLKNKAERANWKVGFLFFL